MIVHQEGIIHTPRGFKSSYFTYGLLSGCCEANGLIMCGGKFYLLATRWML